VAFFKILVVAAFRILVVGIFRNHASMFWMVVPLEGEFKDMDFVGNDVIEISCCSNRPNDHQTRC
jgi:hypothetical protein